MFDSLSPVFDRIMGLLSLENKMCAIVRKLFEQFAVELSTRPTDQLVWTTLAILGYFSARPDDTVKHRTLLWLNIIGNDDVKNECCLGLSYEIAFSHSDIFSPKVFEKRGSN